MKESYKRYLEKKKLLEETKQKVLKKLEEQTKRDSNKIIFKGKKRTYKETLEDFSDSIVREIHVSDKGYENGYVSLNRILLVWISQHYYENGGYDIEPCLKRQPRSSDRLFFPHLAVNNDEESLVVYPCAVPENLFKIFVTAFSNSHIVVVLPEIIHIAKFHEIRFKLALTLLQSHGVEVVCAPYHIENEFEPLDVAELVKSNTPQYYKSLLQEIKELESSKQMEQEVRKQFMADTHETIKQIQDYKRKRQELEDYLKQLQKELLKAEIEKKKKEILEEDAELKKYVKKYNQIKDRKTHFQARYNTEVEEMQRIENERKEFHENVRCILNKNTQQEISELLQ